MKVEIATKLVNPHLLQDSSVTLRDLFAAVALAGLAKGYEECIHLGACVAYQFADAMLAERERTKED